jgi:hypothetical protein
MSSLAIGKRVRIVAKLRPDTVLSAGVIYDHLPTHPHR